MTGLLRHNQGADEPTKPSLSLPADPLEVLFAPASHADFPDVLAPDARPVAALWYRGRLPDRARHPLLAIVGARAASRVGCRRTQELAALASEHGHTIVSGGALGIDAAAHRGALDAGASTFAVLGCGVDVVYPDRHTGLFAEIVCSGGLLSEFPPGTPPRGISSRRATGSWQRWPRRSWWSRRKRIGRPRHRRAGDSNGTSPAGRPRERRHGRVDRQRQGASGMRWRRAVAALAGEARKPTPVPPALLS